MNLSCLFGHSYKEEKVNAIDLQNSKNYIYEVQVLVCRCCKNKKYGEKYVVDQQYYESDLAYSYLQIKLDEPFIITEGSVDSSIIRFKSSLESKVKGKFRSALLEKREDYYIVTMESGPEKYSWRY